MKNHLRFFHLSQSFSQLISIFWILVPSELSRYLLDTHIVITLELSPLLPVLIEENIQNFVQKSKDDPLRVPLTHKGKGRYRFIGHLNMHDFVIMSNSIPGISGNTWKRLSHNELKCIFDLVSHEKTDIRDLVIPMNNTYLLLVVLYSYHARKYHHDFTFLV